jgi:hypothetical protein
MGLSSQTEDANMLQAFFKQPALVAFVGVALLLVIAVYVRTARRWTPEDRTFYERMGRYQQRMALVKLAAYGTVALIVLILLALAQRGLL